MTAPRRSKHALAAALGLALAACGPGDALRIGEAVESAVVRAGELEAHFAGNARSPRQLSGVQALFHAAAPGYDAFDPDAPDAGAGLNFEHVISGHRDPANRFTPRHGPYTLHRTSDPHTVALVRDAADSPWQVRSTMLHTVRAPHYIDLEFRCTPTRRERFGERGHAIFFWANYMNDVAEIPIFFRGVAAAGGEETWIAGDGANPGHPDWRGGGTYRHLDAPALQIDDDHDFRLNSWSYDWPRFTRPFFYGRARHGMVFVVMFDRAWTPLDEVRMSIFKFKVWQRPRPAWDFQYVIHDVQAGTEYGFDARVVWKKWVSAEDCLREYEEWARGR